jgi:hypothetical protein
MEFLWQDCQANLSRLLMCGDANRHSATYGCWDRAYWHYKTIDFPAATFQSVVLPLTLLYKHNLPNNYLYQNPRILELLQATLAFWSKLSGPKGSFNEWYPQEFSFVATAFTAYAVSEAFLSLQGELEPELAARLRDRLGKAGQFLLRHTDPLSNHTAGAIAALYNIYLLQQEKAWAQGLARKLKTFLAAQNKEGWWEEYGGADLGYLSLTIDYLAKYYHKSQDASLLPALERALNFLRYFAAPDGSLGGEYTSRGTKYLMPHGLTLLAAKIPAAAVLLQHFLKGLRAGTLPSLSAVDERYLCFFFYPNYLQATLALQETPPLETSRQDAELLPPQEKYFPECGFFFKRSPAYFAVSGVKKGGLVRVFELQSSSLVFSDAGYWVKLKGQGGTTQYLAPKTKDLYQQGKDWSRIKLQRNFKGLPCFKLTSFKYLLLRSFNLSLGNLEFCSAWLRRFLQKTSLYPTSKLPLTLEREFLWEEAKITIKDVITLKEPLELESLRLESSQSWLLSPTGRYSFPLDFKAYSLPELAAYLKSQDSVMITYTLNFSPSFNLAIEAR